MPYWKLPLRLKPKHNSKIWLKLVSRLTQSQRRFDSSLHLKHMIFFLSEILLTTSTLIMKCCMITLKTLKQLSCSWWISTSSFNSNTPKRRETSLSSKCLEKELMKFKKSVTKQTWKFNNWARRLSLCMGYYKLQSMNSKHRLKKTLSLLINSLKKIQDFVSF